MTPENENNPPAPRKTRFKMPVGKPRNLGRHGRPTYNQAAKVIARFGGESKLAALIGCSRITLYRWQYRRPYGCDGLIPSAQVEKIKGVARAAGVLIRPEDWVPETLHYDENNQTTTDGRNVFFV